MAKTDEHCNPAIASTPEYTRRSDCMPEVRWTIAPIVPLPPTSMGAVRDCETFEYRINTLIVASSLMFALWAQRTYNDASIGLVATIYPLSVHMPILRTPDYLVVGDGFLSKEFNIHNPIIVLALRDNVMSRGQINYVKLYTHGLFAGPCKEKEYRHEQSGNSAHLDRRSTTAQILSLQTLPQIGVQPLLSMYCRQHYLPTVKAKNGLVSRCDLNG
jgi:hypothetical protein